MLLNPVFAGHTIFLWVATPILLVASFIMLAVLATRRRNIRTGAASLSSEEAKILDQLRSD
ncbi:cytochrome c-type biogenesis protein [Pelagibacterium halotolerans B2]|uniref:Cytochrome c-type biogenesis protein n=1 Tax=Pelagibacterium halotolerans (strain DSM 22347 / JCM 15775 / CGMCC 1.7692 / B2) TaxID=1082931 RepID=G4RDN2_PELHB|nr:cytochrome c-type biogenesis protein [Pelagibacterium halotolerans B2]